VCACGRGCDACMYVCVIVRCGVGARACARVCACGRGCDACMYVCVIVHCGVGARACARVCAWGRGQAVRMCVVTARQRLCSGSPLSAWGLPLSLFTVSCSSYLPSIRTLAQPGVQFSTHPHTHTCTSRCAFFHLSTYARLHKQMCISAPIHIHSFHKQVCSSAPIRINTLAQAGVHFCTAAPLLAYVLAHTPLWQKMYISALQRLCLLTSLHTFLVTGNVHFCTAAPLLAYVLAHTPLWQVVCISALQRLCLLTSLHTLPCNRWCAPTVLASCLGDIQSIWSRCGCTHWGKSDSSLPYDCLQRLLCALHRCIPEAAAAARSKGRETRGDPDMGANLALPAICNMCLLAGSGSVFLMTTHLSTPNATESGWE